MITMMTQNYFGVGYCDEDDYLAKTSERVGSKKVDVELKIAWGKNISPPIQTVTNEFVCFQYWKGLCHIHLIFEDLGVKAIVLRVEVGGIVEWGEGVEG